MADLFGHLSPFDLVMIVIATSAATLTLYLVLAVRRLRMLSEDEARGAILTPEEVDQLLTAIGRTDKAEETSAEATAEDDPAPN